MADLLFLLTRSAIFIKLSKFSNYYRLVAFLEAQWHTA